MQTTHRVSLGGARLIRRQAEHQHNVTSTDIKQMAVALALGATVAALVDAVLHVLRGRQQAGHGLAGGLLLVTIMGRLTWAAVAAVAWVEAPILSQWLMGARPTVAT